MVSHRTARILTVVGAALLVIGLLVALYGTTPASVQGTSSIPPDDTQYQYFSEYDFSVLSGGTVSGNFSVLNGTPVTVFVFNDADYNNYVNGANLSGLYTVTGSSGTINLAVPGWNTYHVIFQHPAGYNGTYQDVYVSLSSTGIDPSFFLGGVAAAVIGVVLIVFAVRRLRRAQTAPPSGILESRATYGGPRMPPTGPDTSTSGGGMYRVPPPLPGTPDTAPAAAPQPAAAPAAGPGPMGTVLLTLENQSATDESVTVSVNGLAVSTTTIPAGTTQQASLPTRLASPFGSMVTIDVVTSGGRRAQQSVFVGAHGTAPVTLRIG